MRAALFIVALLASAVSSNAIAGTLENSFGNTFVVRAADGSETQWRYSADGAYTMTDGTQTVSGVWAQNGNQLCTTPAGGAPNCVDLPAGDKIVGDSWTVPTPNGEATISLVAGQN